MSLAPSAQRRNIARPLQILEDLAKIKQQIKTEEKENVGNLDKVPHPATVKQEPGLDKAEHLYGNSSSSGLSELEDRESDTALVALRVKGSQLATDELQERSKRRRNAPKTYVEPESFSSEDVAEPQKGRRTVVKNSWALNGSEESEVDSTASYTSEGKEEYSEEQSLESDFSVGEGEVHSGQEDDSLDEQSDPTYAAQHSGFSRQPQSAVGRHKKNENIGKMPHSMLEYMITHGTRNEVQRSKPWEVIAKECGVAASLEDISEALKQAGIPFDDRLGPKPRAAPNKGQDPLSVQRSLSSQASKSSTQTSGSWPPKLTARDLELVIVAFQCLKDGCKFEVSSNPCILYDPDVLLWLLTRRISSAKLWLTLPTG